MVAEQGPRSELSSGTRALQKEAPYPTTPPGAPYIASFPGPIKTDLDFKIDARWEVTETVTVEVHCTGKVTANLR